MLGAGGCATVYKARHLQLDKEVAVKILQLDGKGETSVRRFLLEARVLCQVDHKNVLKVHSFEKSREGDLLMVVESINGHSLAEELKRGALPVERAVEIWLQICCGMTAVHQLGIVHRDLKPSNIMLTTGADGHELVKVVDFGIARLVAEEGSQSLTRTESVLGSPRYMSPEQWQSASVGHLLVGLPHV